MGGVRSRLLMFAAAGADRRRPALGAGRADAAGPAPAPVAPAPKPAGPAGRARRAGPGQPRFQRRQPQPRRAPVPPPLPPASGTRASAQDLLHYIQQVGGEGSNPADYDPAGLDRRDPVRQSAGDVGQPRPSASTGFRRTWRSATSRRPARIDWYVTDKDLDAGQAGRAAARALAQHQCPRRAATALLPTHPQYAALKAALAMTPATDDGEARPDPPQHGSLALAAARPRRSKYIIVNVPGFHATLVENGVNRWKQRAIAGKLSTPTPQLNATGGRA